MTDFLQLASLEVLRVQQDERTNTVEARGRLQPSACPQCQGNRLYGHGSQDQAYRDVPSLGRPTLLCVHRRRFRCQDCGKTLFDPMPDLDERRLVTRRLIEYVRANIFRETFSSIGRRVDLDEKTVRQIFAEYVDELASKARFQTPRLMGIDELKIIGAYRAIITNVEHRTVYDLLESRSKSSLLPYFRKLRDKDKIEWVAMDMYHVYRQVVRATLGARIVVDKFHIQRMANEVLEKLRKQIRKDLPQRQRLKLKDERFLLLKRQHDLSLEAMARLLEWFRAFPLLGEAHALKEGFLAVWDKRDRRNAEYSYQTWLSNITPELQPVFKELTTAMANWHDEVFNYFERPITNAYTESVNGLARAMNRMGRGYSFEVLRARLLYDDVARKDGSVRVRKPRRDSGFQMQRVMHSVSKASSGTGDGIIEYGPYIPTLTKLLESGYFE